MGGGRLSTSAIPRPAASAPIAVRAIIILELFINSILSRCSRALYHDAAFPTGSSVLQADELKTVGDLVRFGASRLNAAGVCFGHGTDNAADESRVLVFHALALDFDVPAYFYQARVTADERAAALEIIERRVSDGVPAAYLTGEAWFAGLRFEITPDVLVPRSPIAEMIQGGFVPWCEPGTLQRALDIGTGSGCIAIAVAAHLGVATDAVDISPDALAVAKQNVTAHDLEDLVNVFESDVYSGVAGQRYDLIVSNPPYVSSTSMSALPDEYASEPQLALAAGNDGLEVIHRILASACDHLTPHGVLVVESGESSAALVAAYPGIGFEWVNFQHGGGGVFVLTAAELARCQAQLSGRCA
ncbi:MAG: 50S ribosomal protein L3 N(5)-glutamine methyltransferase [Gammaproteobacteria bacterium]|nr:50S ribosomal protein L3 N(5)-glutamine methyltransferase [Gammaproteobacteria bacterium]NNF59990.1 50S ribosomal protein L3 N(5)-glutamine methyltransferase [Gammaproteobacteria bacterium]NNM21450.1 50S ribosomal protein L3 N(5)-glutamine methyltransferase [Gammaproteobacteria bacterium]